LPALRGQGDRVFRRVRRRRGPPRRV